MNEETAHWVRLFNRLDAAVSHYVRDEGVFRSDAGDRLAAARARIYKDACKRNRDTEPPRP